MSHLLCADARKDGEKIKLYVAESNVYPRTYEWREWKHSMEELEQMFGSGEIQLNRKPRTKLTKHLAEQWEKTRILRGLEMLLEESGSLAKATISEAINWIEEH